MARTPLQARPTLYKGIQMRSRLEAEFAAFLDRVMAAHPEKWSPPAWEYEPMCFANERGQYLPDFGVFEVSGDGDGTLIRVYIEIKPSIGGNLRLFQARMETIWASEPAAGLRLVEWADGGGVRSWTGWRGTWMAEDARDRQGTAVIY